MSGGGLPNRSRGSDQIDPSGNSLVPEANIGSDNSRELMPCTHPMLDRLHYDKHSMIVNYGMGLLFH